MTAHKTCSLTEHTPEIIRSPEDYVPIVGEERVQELVRLATPLQGKGWANVNSALVGGGVAELLRASVPLARGLGLDARWYVMEGGEDFFRVTKKFHNMLQGQHEELELEEIFGAYLGTIDDNVRNAFITSDLVVVHDPQPAAMVMNGIIYGNVIWRCHIDTSDPASVVWRFLLPYINHCAGAIFTMPEFVGAGLHVPVYQIMPSIDPLSDKNIDRTPDEARDVLQPIFLKAGIDPERPIFAAISRYDIHKNQATVIDAFKAFVDATSYDPRPQLVFLGNTAEDDPEGDGILEGLTERADGHPDIFFLANVENNDAVVGSLLDVAECFIHVPTREGFGLVVTEALWHRTTVIGSRAGGVVAQVRDGQTGFVTDPLDTDGIAKSMHDVMEKTDLCQGLCEAGRAHVREFFLLPEQMRRYLLLMRYYAHVDRIPPDFRLSDLTYSELIGAMRPRPPFFPD
ncbi:glycosyltransferase [Desulfobaculum senezii]